MNNKYLNNCSLFIDTNIDDLITNTNVLSMLPIIKTNKITP